MSPSDDVSSKRLITIIAFALMCLGFIGNMFFGLTVEQYIYESMQWVVNVGLGSILGEKLISNSKKRQKTDTTKQDKKVVEDEEPMG